MKKWRFKEVKQLFKVMQLLNGKVMSQTQVHPIPNPDAPYLTMLLSSRKKNKHTNKLQQKQNQNLWTKWYELSTFAWPV